ncbi:MAG: FAD-binding protein, partial [Lysobacterales bacterium]
MKVTHAPSLEKLNTLGLETTASSLVEVETEEDVLMLPGFDPDRDFVLGGGSNVVFLSNVPGTVYLVRLAGIDITAEEGERATVDIGAGVGWHELVTWALESNLHGLENLALIPGTVGGAPI